MSSFNYIEKLGNKKVSFIWYSDFYINHDLILLTKSLENNIATFFFGGGGGQGFFHVRFFKLFAFSLWMNLKGMLV